MTVFKSTDPATGAVNWQGEAASPAQVQAAVDAARAAFPDWADRPRQARVDAQREVTRLRLAVGGDTHRVFARRRGRPALGRRGASTRLRQASRRHELREQNDREGRSTPHRIPGAAEPYMAGRME